MSKAATKDLASARDAAGGWAHRRCEIASQVSQVGSVRIGRGRMREMSEGYEESSLGVAEASVSDRSM